jgi:hypothetical protein
LVSQVYVGLRYFQQVLLSLAVPVTLRSPNAFNFITAHSVSFAWLLCGVALSR